MCICALNRFRLEFYPSGSLLHDVTRSFVIVIVIIKQKKKQANYFMMEVANR